MHGEYGKQIISEEYFLSESPSAEGYLDPKGNYKNKSKKVLYVYENEGHYPHSHIVGLGKDSNKEVCVRLDKAEYFCHGVKQSKFTPDEKKMFISFITSKDSFGTVRWNWAAATWNGFAQDNENMNSINIKKCPNYKDLEVESS